MSEFLITELRILRTSRGLSQEDFGKAIKYSGSHVSSVETGQRPPTEEYLEAVDRVFETGGLFSRLLVRINTLEVVHVWLRPWIEVERDAIVLKSYEPLVIPGLLQTEAYARSLLSTGTLPAGQLDPQVRARIDRQQVLGQDNPPLLFAVIDETVLRRAVGGAAVMREQLDHLLMASERPNVNIHIVPASTGAYVGLNGAFVIATLPDSRELAYLDHQLEGLVSERPNDILPVREAWEKVRGVALPVQQSIELIREVAKTWT
ncbi:helix-turn-helix transcriptional regulator [Plantactinospora sp. KLBMP9567]|uniref:helix-turn-helix domain-containing protein n=1 Tax=Plantactinospora sp. KLBMP9567 TaxID=3085900 RepID=UPI002980BC44|nr:helix-turn-helix transcriptional regulator [Plantactinospora sp. KLBMP9567]MDW5323747.1 helix-turn-helix transcriptional regulator [Plantactinospora sp. KLBMP9567]MDW5326867.1 helix-turn-helix transcriptional regulator [Plantactinospora sp. KLBMP9567]